MAISRPLRGSRGLGPCRVSCGFPHVVSAAAFCTSAGLAAFLGWNSQDELFGLRGFGAGSAAEGDVAHVRVVDAFAFEKFGDSENLQAWVVQVFRAAFAPGRFVDSGSGGFGAHGFGGVFEGDEDADFGFFAFDDAAQIADMRDVDVAGFHGEDNLFGRAAFALVVKVKAAIDALIAAFALLGSARADKAERPPLKLVRIVFGELFGIGKRGWLADDFVGFLHGLAECVAKTALDEADGEMRDVYADPVAIEALRDGDGCAAAAERVENRVAFVATRFDYAFE